MLPCKIVSTLFEWVLTEKIYSFTEKIQVLKYAFFFWMTKDASENNLKSSNFKTLLFYLPQYFTFMPKKRKWRELNGDYESIKPRLDLPWQSKWPWALLAPINIFPSSPLCHRRSKWGFRFSPVFVRQKTNCLSVIILQVWLARKSDGRNSWNIRAGGGGCRSCRSGRRSLNFNSLGWEFEFQ